MQESGGAVDRSSAKLGRNNVGSGTQSDRFGPQTVPNTTETRADGVLETESSHYSIIGVVPVKDRTTSFAFNTFTTLDTKKRYLGYFAVHPRRLRELEFTSLRYERC